MTDPKHPLPADLAATAEAALRRETKHAVLTLQHDQFEVCKPLIREMGWIRKKVLLVHRTAEGKWDIKKVTI